MNEYSGRYYADGGIAPHVTGYVSAIQAGEQDQYLRAGFQLDDRVGRSGLELYGQNYLLGQRGATLDVYDPNGLPVTRLAKVDRKPSQSIYTTIDSNLQIEAQKALAGFTGGLVVIERDTGRVLAMVSSPGFDPNAFEFRNYNSGPLLGQILGDSQNREYNRAAGNGYPLGSVFKLVTMAAALESGVFTPESTYECGHFYTELTGWTLEDWTYAKGVNPSGTLTLPEGLMRSCNPWFYHIGYELYNQNRTKDVSNMARAFGLGSKTGIEGIEEEAGNIPDPNEIGMAVQMAIGQSEILVNPLQVARFVAAIGNGGTLYKPQLIEKVVDPDNNPSFTFHEQAQGTLPVKPENLAVIQAAMRSVVASPRGTAVRAFSGLGIPVYGKTGTAQNDWPGHPHAWFAGYTDAGRSDRPDIAVAVIAEYAGEGSEIAAYIYRRIMEIYFMGQAQAVYPWETRLNVTRTPTLDVTLTPEPPGGGSSSSGGSSGGSSGDPGFNLRTATPSQ
jgi:penicillin-binding protein 2